MAHSLVSSDGLSCLTAVFDEGERQRALVLKVGGGIVRGRSACDRKGRIWPGSWPRRWMLLAKAGGQMRSGGLTWTVGQRAREARGRAAFSLRSWTRARLTNVCSIATRRSRSSIGESVLAPPVRARPHGREAEPWRLALL
jgi:hypothetical protein